MPRNPLGAALTPPRPAEIAQPRVFTAASMPEALLLVKKAFGPDAVILGARTLDQSGLRGLVGRKRVEITAGPPPLASPAPRLRVGTGRGAPTPEDRPGTARRANRPSTAPPASHALPDAVQQHFLRLVQNDVGHELAEQLVREAAASGGRIEDVLRRFIADMVPVSGGITLTPGRVRRVALVGPTGAGKTTTIAKLAAHFRLRERRRVAILTLDTRRLAAVEQLRRYADLIRVPISAADSADAARAACAQAGAADLLLIDTPGIGARDGETLNALQAMLSDLEIDETHLVMPASMTAAAQERTAALLQPLGVTQLVLTRLDDAVGFGVVLDVVKRLRWRLSYVSNGQSVPGDLIQACSRRMAELILPTQTTGSSA